MNSEMPIYAEHYSSIKSIAANKLSMIIYFIPLVLSIIPYAQYIVWLIPLYFLLAEKDSELVKYSSAQCLVLYFLNAVIAIVITLFSTLFSYPSSCVVTAILNITKATFPSVLYILLFVVMTILTLVSARNAQKYVSYRFKAILSTVEKFVAL